MAILTISRELGSGGRGIGRAVADVMSYDYVDRKRIFEDMRKEGKRWEETARQFDENYPNLMERSDWSYKCFVALNQSHFLEHAVRGNVVIIGRGGSFLLGAFPMVLKVRIRAPLEKRIERIMEREDMNRENAQYLIEKVDSEMAKAVYLIYGKDLNDPDEYDMVLDTSQAGKDEIVDTIKKALIEKDVLNTEGARQALELRALAEKMKATIMINPNFSLSMLDVDPAEEGMPKYGFVVRGVVHEPNDIEEIKTLAREMAGDLPVESRLQYRMYGRFGR